MKYLVIVLIAAAVLDVAFNHAAVIIGIWTALGELFASVRRGVWASE